jgi:hypothetical protein
MQLPAIVLGAETRYKTCLRAWNFYPEIIKAVACSLKHHEEL